MKIGSASACAIHDICASHNAGVLGNLCIPGLAKARADREKRRQEAAAKYRTKQSEAHKYIQSGSARLALLTAGAPPVNIYQTQRKKEKKGIFGGNYQWVEVVTSVRQGWILGPFTRNPYSVFGFPGDDLTALLDLDQVVLISVTPYLNSYQELEVTNDNLEIERYKIIELAEAVMSLIELKQLGIQSIFSRRLPSMYDNLSREGQVLAGGSSFLRVKEVKEAEQIYEIDKEKYSIGPNTESDIYLAKNATVMNLGNGNYALETEDSEVKINRQELAKYQPCPLQEGDRIQFGQTVLVFGTK
jgi:hypothetical protein